MRAIGRPLSSIIIVAILVLVITGAIYADRASRIAGGYVARDLCVEVFINDEDAKKAQTANFGGLSPVAKLISHRIDDEAKTLSAGIRPFRYSHAYYNEGYGCVIKQGKLPNLPKLAPVENVPLPQGDPDELGFDAAILNAVLDKAVADQDHQHRAVLVMRA